MNNQNFTMSATALAVILGLGGCGGGGGSSESGSAPGTVQGVITGFGSVFVNGVEYEVTNNTSITVDEQDSLEDSLQVGMLVTVSGSVNADGATGTASSITFADELEGVVTANSVATDGTGTVTVMGQTVTVTGSTVFESAVAGVTAPHLIAPGHIVEVSGYASSAGEIVATRLEVKKEAQGSGDEIEVKGTIMGLDLGAATFMLGGLTVDYSAAALPDGGLTDGLYVEVKSSSIYDANSAGPLVASKVELESNGVKGHDGDEGEEIKIEGMVTADVAGDLSQFEVNGRTVLIDGQTEFEQGAANQLLTGVRVEVEARFNGAGDLVAHEVEFGHEDELELGGAVEAIDAAAHTVTLLGRTVTVTNNTIMIDHSANEVRYFSLDDVSAGERVTVKAYEDSALGLVATKLERKDGSGNEAEVEGRATVAGGVITVAGVTVDLSSGTIQTVVVDGDTVEIHGTYSGGILYATTVALDD